MPVVRTAKRASPAKCWCFTWNNPPSDGVFENRLRELEAEEEIRYAVWQLEKGASGTLHWQGYVAFKKKLRMQPVKDLLGATAIHLEKAKGTAKQNRRYCTKDEGRQDGPWELGSCPALGKAALMNGLWDSIVKDPLNIYDVVAEEPALLHYEKAINFAISLQLEKKGNQWRDVSLEVLMGPPGCGKTLYGAQDGYKDVFIVSKVGKTLWFDGYRGQATIIFDDVSDDWKEAVKYSTWLRLLDGHPVRLPVKGCTMPACYTRIIITSNQPIMGWFPERTEVEALLRRCTRFLTFTRGGDYYEDGVLVGNALALIPSSPAIAEGGGGGGGNLDGVVPGSSSAGNTTPQNCGTLGRAGAFVAPNEAALVLASLRVLGADLEYPEDYSPSMPTSLSPLPTIFEVDE